MSDILQRRQRWAAAANVCLTLATLIALALPTVAGAQQTQYPLAIATHGETIYLADRTLPGIWKSEAGKLSVFFQGSKKLRTPLNAPRCLAVDGAGRVYAGDSATREVYRFDADGQPQPLTSGTIGIPMGIAVTGEGNLLVSDLEVNRIWKISLPIDQDARLEKYADVPAPAGVRLDGEGRLWVVSRGDNALYRVATDGKVDVAATGRQFEFPHDVAIAADGTAFVSDGYARAVWRLRSKGKAEKWVSGDPFVNPIGLAWQGEKLLVVDPRANAVFQVDTDGQVTALNLGQSQAERDRRAAP